MLLAAFTFASALLFAGNAPAGAPGSAPASTVSQASFSKLPPTQPGLSNDEGAFLVTTADDGSQAVYFIASNSRHSILWTDMQIELQLNPLWPVFTATPDQVQAFPEGAPIGAARIGLNGGGATPVAPAAQPLPAPQPADPQPAAVAPAEPPAQPAPAAEPMPAQAHDNDATNAQPTPAQAHDNDANAQPTPAQAHGNASAEPMPSQAQDNDASAQTTTYTLRPGDNLTRIAARYGTSVDAILAANGVANPNRIYAGQSILIPTGDDTSAVQAEAPASDDTSLADAPPASEDSSAVDPTTYTVQRGDSAIKIARLFGIDEGSLLDANGITNPNRVYVGQVLTIPGSSS